MLRRLAVAALAVAALSPAAAQARAEVPAGTACHATAAGVTGPSSCRPVARAFARIAERRADALDTATCSRSTVTAPHWRCKAYMSSGAIVQAERWGASWRSVVVR